MKDKNLLYLYRFFNNPVIVLLRILTFCFFLFIFIMRYEGFLSYNQALSFYFFFLANEVFVHYGLNRALPMVNVDEAKDFKDALMLKAHARFAAVISAYDVISRFAKSSEAKVLNKAISPDFTLVKSSISKEELIKKAGEIVKFCKGKYITLFDLYIAYVFLTEDESKEMQKAEVKEVDLMLFYKYLRRKFVTDEVSKVFEFTGNGAFDFFVFGWNREVQQYAWNLTESVITLHHPMTIDLRKNEYEQFLTALGKSRSSNVILKGNSGTGRTHLVKYFAQESHFGNTPDGLKKKIVFEVLVDRLLAGIDSQGKLDERLNLLFEDLAHSGNVVVFVQNIENIFGGGGFGFDSSGMLFEYLKNSRVQIVGTTTDAGFAEYFENKQAVASLFDVVNLPPLSLESTKEVLFEESWEKMRERGVFINLPALLGIAAYADEYYPSRALPGAAVDLLEETISFCESQKSSVIDKNVVQELVQKKTRIVLSDPTKEEREMLLHLEDKIHERLINQEEAVKAIASAMRRVRSGFSNKERPIASMLFLGPTGVGKTETAKALAQIYFGDENAMIRLDMSELQTEDSILKILGEERGATHQENSLVSQVTEKPFSLILLDEFEKAHPSILNLFLQVFEDGRLTSSKGNVVSFKNTIIVATSNAGSEFIRQNITSQDLKPHLLDYLLTNNLFRPELVNRFDELIVFMPLSDFHVLQVTSLLLKGALSSLEDEEIYIKFDQKAVEKISRESYDVQFGARNMRRYIQKEVEEFVAKLILENKLQKGEHKTLSVDEKGLFVLN